MRRLELACVAGLALAACSPVPAAGDAGVDGGGGSSSGGLAGGLSLTAVNPTHGPVGGGTPVALAGSGFGPGLSLTFGGTPAQQISVLSSSQVTALTPPGSDGGAVDVVADLAGVTATLHGGFTYDLGPQVDYCIVKFPSALTAAPDSQTGLVYGRVHVPNVTTSAGNQGEIVAQVGWGTLGSVPDGTWVWSSATFNAQCNQCGQNYEYQGAMQAGAAGSYAMAYRFSADHGNSWTDCDTHGDTPSAPYSPANQATLTVAAPDGGADAGPAIGWCDLKSPDTLNATPGSSAGPLYGQVWIPGYTNAGGDPAAIAAQVGYGPSGGDPADAGWSWTKASFNAGCTTCSGANYEYDTPIVAPGPGSYALAYRFSFEDGGWVDCDTVGTPYDPSNSGVLTVEVADAGSGDGGLAIGWCDLKYPDALAAVTGAVAGPLYGQVYVSGFTNAGGDPAALAAQLGYGPVGSDPAGAGWTWLAAAYNPGCTTCGGNNDEYDTTLVMPAPGSYALAYRFSFEDGGWVDCDTAGIPYDPAKAGTLTATAIDAGVDAGGGDAGAADAGPDAGPVPIAWCDYRAPNPLALEPGAPSGLLYAQVLSPGVTTVAGNQAEIRAQIGYGPAGSDPADAGWSWSDATFNPSCASCGGQNYEYDTSFAAPGAGSWALAARFSGDRGATWVDCDAAGDATYAPANAGVLTVRWLAVSWCDLQFPATLSGAVGVDAGPVYGRVDEPGVTDANGDPASIWAEVGLGPPGTNPTDPDAGWRWWTSPYNPGCLLCGNNYEYQGWLVPPDAGSWAYATRFSVDDGGYWTACGLGGPWSPDGGSDAGLLAVP